MKPFTRHASQTDITYGLLTYPRLPHIGGYRWPGIVPRDSEPKAHPTPLDKIVLAEATSEAATGEKDLWG